MQWWFLGKGSVNMFPRQPLRMQREGERDVVYAVRAEDIYKIELGNQFSWALQGRLRRDGARVELTVDKEFCTGGCDKGTWAREAEESPLL
jgi:hypothetical protein